MTVQLQDYPSMVDKLGKGGFDADQSAALIELMGRLFSDQNKHIDKVLKETRRENQREHEKTRAQFDKLDNKLENKFEILDAKIERNWRWTIAVLTAISVSLMTVLIPFLLRFLE